LRASFFFDDNFANQNKIKDMNQTDQLTHDHKSKEDIYWAVLDSVIRLDIQKGHLSWTISDLARASKITRPLIYYYFGNSKENIMKTAIEFLGEEYFGLSDARIKLWSEGKVVESVLLSRLLCQKAPYVHIFFMIRRNQNSFVGETLREYESRYRNKIRKFYPNVTNDSIDALAAVFFGLVAMPDLSETGVRNALELIQSNLEFSGTKTAN
jgi:AcrR family transcriptional regulator